jgi:hypothetical protein
MSYSRTFTKFTKFTKFIKVSYQPLSASTDTIHRVPFIYCNAKIGYLLVRSHEEFTVQ